MLQRAGFDPPGIELTSHTPIRLFVRAAVRACGLVHRARMLRQFIDDVVVRSTRSIDEDRPYAVRPIHIAIPHV
jgi:hypothetical protein